MSRKIKTLLATIFMSSMLLSVVGPVQHGYALFENATKDACEGATLGSKRDCTAGQDDKITNLIKAIVNILSTIIGIAAVIVIMLAGFRYITAGGDANSISAAKNTLIYAIVGLVVAALAQVIVRFVLNKV